jgi:hypothetical protein
MPTAAKLLGTRKLWQDAPRPGTKLRAIYDLLTDNPGECVELDIRKNSRIIGQLTDFYGLDIRQVQRGYRRGIINRPSVYLLAGVWNGRDYTDFTENLFKDDDLK